MTQLYKPEWLEMVKEDALDPAMPIVDAHHHLYDDEVRNATFGRFMTPQFLAEIQASGHNVISTVYCEAHKSFADTNSPAELQAVGETRQANAVAEEAHRLAPNGPRICEGIVFNADLMMGDRVDSVLQAHIDAAPERVRGVRDNVANDPDVPLPYTVSSKVILDEAMHDGVRCLVRRNLAWDVWVFHPQLGDVAAAARALPDARIVLNHLGTPLAVGRYKDRMAETFVEWRKALAEVAAQPNVNVKLSAMFMPFCGLSFEDRDRPPTSEEAAAAIGDYYQAAIELFGPERCMFTSNWPRDRVTISYPVLWNTYKRMVAGFSQDERNAMFHGTAARVYRLSAL